MASLKKKKRLLCELNIKVPTCTDTCMQPAPGNAPPKASKKGSALKIPLWLLKQQGQLQAFLCLLATALTPLSNVLFYDTQLNWR